MDSCYPCLSDFCSIRKRYVLWLNKYLLVYSVVCCMWILKYIYRVKANNLPYKMTQTI